MKKNLTLFISFLLFTALFGQGNQTNFEILEHGGCGTTEDCTVSGGCDNVMHTYQGGAVRANVEIDNNTRIMSVILSKCDPNHPLFNRNGHIGFRERTCDCNTNNLTGLSTTDYTAGNNVISFTVPLPADFTSGERVYYAMIQALGTGDQAHLYYRSGPIKIKATPAPQIPNLKLVNPPCLGATPVTSTAYFVGGLMNLNIELQKTVATAAFKTQIKVLLGENELHREEVEYLAATQTRTISIQDLPLNVAAAGTYPLKIQYKKNDVFVDVVPNGCPQPLNIVVEAPDLPEGATAPQAIAPGKPILPTTLAQWAAAKNLTLEPNFIWRNMPIAQRLKVHIEKREENGSWTRLHTSAELVRNLATNNYANTYLLATGILEYKTKYKWWVESFNSDNTTATSPPLFFQTPSEVNADCSNVFDVDDATQLELFAAVQYLCKRGIITPKPNPNGSNSTIVKPLESILRLDLAWITVAGLYGSKNAVPERLYTDKYIVPYHDLADAYRNEYRYPKFLSYLKLSNKIAPFDYDRGNFHPYDGLWRINAIKVLMEAFNIVPDENPSNAANLQLGVPTTEKHYKYVAKALERGYLAGYDATNFQWDSEMTRGDAFKILYRIMKATNITRPTVAELKAKVNFLRDDHFDKASFAQKPGLVDGNFEHHESAVFNIPDIKTSLNFNFSYHSYLKPKPKDWHPYTPLGTCWTHSQNSYIKFSAGWQKVSVSGNVQTTITHLPDYVVFLPGSATPHYWQHASLNLNSAIKKVTDNIYYDFDKNGNNIVLTMLDRTVLTFEKITGGDANTFWLKSVKDKNNNVTNYEYQRFTYQNQPHDRLIKVTAPSGRFLSFLYETANPSHIAQVHAPGESGNGQRAIIFGYDGDDLKIYTGLMGERTTYNYNRGEQAHLLNSITLPKGNIITNEYDDNHLRASKTTDANGNVPQGVVLESIYDSFDGVRINTVKDLNGNQLEKVTYDDKRKTATIESPRPNANGGTTMAKTKLEFKDPNHPRLPTYMMNETQGIAISNAYNNNAQPLSRRTKDVNSIYVLNESWTYEDDFLKSYTDPRNHTMTINYVGTEKNVSSIVDFEGQTTTFGYEGAMGDKGLVKSVTSPIGITYRMTYNIYGNPIKVTAPNGVFSQVDYDFSSRVKKSYKPRMLSDANPAFTEYFYRRDDLVNKVINPEGKATEYTYTQNKFLETIKNANGGITTMTYRFEDDMLQQMQFGNDITRYGYDNKGRLKEYKKPKDTDFKRLTYYDNDILKEDAFYKYFLNAKDLPLRTELKTDANNQITYDYDALNRLEKYTVSYPIGGNQHGSYTIRYELDPNGNPRQVFFSTPTFAETRIAQYEYDANNRMTKAFDKNGLEYEMQRRLDGTPGMLLYPNGMRKKYDYDNNNRVERFGYYKSMNEAVPNTLASYSYVLNNLGYIQSETYREPLPLPVLPDASVTFTPNNVNRYTTVTDANGAVTQSFDANGNQQNTPKYNLTWNEKDQLSGLTSIGTGALTLTNYFNVNGLRCAATRNGITTRYAHDLSGIGNVVVEMDALGNPTTFYLHAFEEGMLSRIEVLPNNNTRTRYYEHDVRGSTVAMTDENHNFTHKYAYSDYGEVAANWMATGERENRYTFVGAHGVEMETNQLFYMRARFYDAQQKRFLAQDPIWNVNLYPYAGNNPVMRTDAQGKQYTDALVGAGSVAPMNSNPIPFNFTEPIEAKPKPEYITDKVDVKKYNKNKPYCGPNGPMTDKAAIIMPSTQAGNFSCFIHDNQYDIWGYSKSKADEIFFFNTYIELRSKGNNQISSLGGAMLYYKAVATLGGIPYLQGQYSSLPDLPALPALPSQKEIVNGFIYQATHGMGATYWE